VRNKPIMPSINIGQRHEKSSKTTKHTTIGVIK